MKGKVKDAEAEVRRLRGQFDRKFKYLQRRLGHYWEVMRAFNTIVQAEFTREWEEGRQKNSNKIEHLENRWGKKSKRSHVGDNGVWRGIKFGDEALEEIEPIVKQALRYGGVITSPEEDTVLCHPSGFTSFEAITKDKLEVAADIL